MQGGSTGQACVAGGREAHSPRAPLLLRKALTAGLRWRQACLPLPESRAVRSFALLLPLTRSVCASGQRGASPTSSPGALQRHTGWAARGEGSAWACYLESPRGGVGREGAAGAGWTGLPRWCRQDEFLTNQDHHLGKRAVGRRSGEAGGRCPREVHSQFPLGSDHPDP